MRRTYQPLPLSPAALAQIERVTRALCGPYTPAQLASAVAALSRLYTRERAQLESGAEPLLARAGFFFARDLVKPFGPLDALVHASKAPLRGDTLRVLDLGAGLGATSFGLARWLRLRGMPAQRVNVLALEQNAGALRGFGAMASALRELPDEFTPLTLDARTGDLRSMQGRRDFQLVLFGFVLNELFTELPLDQRIARRAELVLAASERLAPDGALIILEPALKETTRELMMLRDRLAASAGPQIVAPCLHSQGCPMLPRERDWCHQELPYALPAALAEVARAASLRWEGLRYASLVLSAQPAEPRAGLYRVVSDRLESKGKLELYGCGDGQLVRFDQLNRQRSEQNQAFADAARGDVLAIAPVQPRIGPDTRVERR